MSNYYVLNRERWVVLSFLVFTASWNAPGTWIANGPAGGLTEQSQGRIRSIQIIPDPANPGDFDIYIGASQGGLWMARGSAGPVWTSLGDNLPMPAVGAFSVNPDDPTDILVGTGDWQRSPAGTGMFHSHTAGSTWTQVTLPASVSPQYFFRLYRLPGNPNVVEAATDQGLLLSTSGPDGPWTNALSGFVSDLVLHPTIPNIQYCARSFFGTDPRNGVYKSIDGGQHWTQLTQVPTTSFGRGCLAICRDEPNTIAFVCENGCNITNNGLSGVFESTDGGAFWSNITGNVDLGNKQSCHAMAIAFRPNNPNEIFVAANNLWRTEDGGQSPWAYTDNIKPHQDLNQMLFSSLTGDDVMWQCSDGGIYRVDVNAISWSSWNGNASSGLSISEIADMDARGGVRAIGKQDDWAVVSADGGGSWHGVDPSSPDVYTVAIADTNAPTMWYQFNDDTTIHAYNLSSGTDSDVSDSITGAGNQLGPLVFDPFTSRIFSLVPNANSLSLVSQDASTTTSAAWARELTGLPTGLGGMTISPADGQSTYLWGDGAGRGKLFVLEKSGSTWSLSRSPIIGLVNGNTYSIQSVTASPDQPGECWAGLAGNLQILHTTDNWRTWYPLSPVPGKVAFQSSIISLSRIVGITVTPHFTSQMFVATDNTVFWTYNGGTSWLVFQDGLPAWAPCNVIRYLNNGDGAGHDALVLSTYGRGMYAANQLGVVFVDQGNATGVEDGTITHPYSSIPNGVNGTPNGGVMAINGLTKYSVPSPYNNFTKPMTITSYGAQTTITH